MVQFVAQVGGERVTTGHGRVEKVLFLGNGGIHQKAPAKMNDFPDGAARRRGKTIMTAARLDNRVAGIHMNERDLSFI
ncbi:hypothetical protein GCM10009828_096640 [Actinoplanes couchii]